MKKVQTITICSALSLMICGCSTSIKSTKLTDYTSSTNPPGLVYQLPAKRFVVKVSYRITSCVSSGGNANLNADVTAKLVESLVGRERYILDYQLLNAMTKVSETEFHVSETGLLMGVNASITDRSGAIIQNFASTAAGVARAVALPTVPLTDSFFTFVQDLDNQKTKADALSMVKSKLPDYYAYFSDYKGRLGELKQDLSNPCTPFEKLFSEQKQLESQLKIEKNSDKHRDTLLKRRVAKNQELDSFSRLVEYYEKIGDLEEKKLLTNQIRLNKIEFTKIESDLVAVGESQTDEIQKKLNEIKSKLELSGEVDFVPDQTNEVQLIAISKEEIKAKFEGTAVENINLPDVSVAVSAINNFPSCDSNTEKCLPIKDGLVGIAYRVPVPAVVKVSVDYKSVAQRNEVILEKLTSVPQFGPVANLRLDNGAFDDNLIEIAFSGATGSPVKVTFKAKSKAENLSLTTNDIANTYLKLQQDKNSDINAYNQQYVVQKKSEVDLNSAISDLNAKSSDYRIKSQLDEVNLQQSLVKAQLEILREQQRIDAVRTGTATTAEFELEAMKNQEQILIQKLNILKLQREIEELQRASAGD